MLGVLTFFSGCSTLKDKIYSDADQTALAFLNNLEKSDRQAAYHLFAKGLSQTVSFDQFDGLMDTFQKHWGRIESYQTAVLPFHKREGESNFIPLNTSLDNIKRYVFDVQFENSKMNCDMTLVFDGSDYKIVWFSFWGSNIYMSSEITNKIQDLFSKASETGQK